MQRIVKPSTAFSVDPAQRRTRGRPQLKLDKHRIWIKSLRSIISGSRVDVDPHHVKRVDQSVGKPTDSAGKRVDDIFLVPLARDLHDELHEITEKVFEEKYGIDLVKLALGFFALSSDDQRAEISINWTIYRAKEVERANV